MNGRIYRVLGSLAILLLLALVSFESTWHQSVAAKMVRTGNNREPGEAREAPPEDWFITQRVTHGGIPAGAMERAGAQAE